MKTSGIFAVLVSIGSLLTARPALAQTTYTVTTLTDVGNPGELRAAITAANNDTGDTIRFAPGLSGTITLTSGLPQITSSMTIR
jgi:hypothetical protein